MRLTPITKLACFAHGSVSKFSRSKLTFLGRRCLASQSSQTQPQVAEEAPKSVAEAEAKPKREPVIKNFILGRFDNEFLGYPELSKAGIKAMNEEWLPQIQQLVRTETSRATDASGKVEESILLELKRLGVFGMSIPKAYGGLEMSSMEYCRILEEIGENPGLFGRVFTHSGWVAQAIVKFGTDEQKQQYLPGLASGELTGAWCFAENSGGFDPRAFESFAIRKGEKDDFVLNGTKLPVINGTDADFFVVFAKTRGEDFLHNPSWESSAFLVHKDSPGIEVSPIGVTGMRGAGVASVKFTDVRVPMKNILGIENVGFEHAVDVLNGSYFMTGALCVAQMKKMVNDVVKFCVPRSSVLEPYSKHDIIRERIAKMSTKAYMAESMLYATCGIIDSGEYPEYEVESAVTKIYASEAAFEVAVEASRQFGFRSVLSGHDSEQYLRNCYPLWLLGTPNDILRIYIAVKSIEHAAKEMQMGVTIKRHPYDNPEVVVREGARGLLDFLPIIGEKRRSRLKYYLHGHLHPTLKMHADELEKLILNYPRIAEIIMVDTGVTIGARQVVLKRISDISTNMYAISCGLARASRSHCIGLKNSTVELGVVARASEEMFTEVKTLFGTLEERTIGSLQHRMCDSGKKILNQKEYCFDHALSHNWD